MSQSSSDGDSDESQNSGDENPSEAQDFSDENPSEVDDTEDENSNGIEDFDASEDSGDENSNSIADSSVENSDESEDSKDEDVGLDADIDITKDNRTSYIYAHLARTEDQLTDVKLVSKYYGDFSDYKTIHNCYYDFSKPYKDEDTGYYDLHFEVFYDWGGSFFNQRDTNYLVDTSTVLFDGRPPNLFWARGLPLLADSAGGPSGESDQDISLNKTIWKLLPEEILFRILMWLPPAAQSRLRCVCSKWKSVLSSPMALLDCNSMGKKPFCTIKSNGRASHDSAYCHTERKWFDLPCNVVKSLFKWRLADVEGELFCYQNSHEEQGLGFGEVDHIWMAVCNPMIPESSLLLPPIDATGGMAECIKLLVDRQAKTFKVVMLLLGEAAIFDSVSFEWTTISFSTASSFDSMQLFLHNGVVYCVEGEICPELFVLNMASQTWSKVDVDFPCEIGRKFAIVSSKNQVMIVQVKQKGRECVHIWKLLTDIPDHVPLFSAASWKKQDVALPKALRILALDFRGCTLHGSQYLFFNGGRTNQWIQYDFSKRTWCVMPFRGRRIARLLWFEWEPGFDMDLSAIQRKQL